MKPFWRPTSRAGRGNQRLPAIRNHLKAQAERLLAVAGEYFRLVDGGVLSSRQAVDKLRKYLLAQTVGTSG